MNQTIGQLLFFGWEDVQERKKMYDLVQFPLSDLNAQNPNM